MIPVMYILEDSVELDRILITGESYRKSQLRGYQQYRRFLNSIITDSTRFVDMHQLEVFIQRNIPELYKYRTDSAYVSDELFMSHYGITEKEALNTIHMVCAFAATNGRKIISAKCMTGMSKSDCD